MKKIELRVVASAPKREMAGLGREFFEEWKADPDPAKMARIIDDVGRSKLALRVYSLLRGTTEEAAPIAAGDLSKALSPESFKLTVETRAKLESACSKMADALTEKQLTAEFHEAVGYVVDNARYFPVESKAAAPNLTGSQAVETLTNSYFTLQALRPILKTWGVPENDFEATAAELERVARARANVTTGAQRPKWDQRGKYAELKDLNAPQFLKRVYADVIAPDGTVSKKLIRDIDAKLMASVEVYLSARKSRKQDAGDAAGLRLLGGVTSPLRGASRE